MSGPIVVETCGSRFFDSLLRVYTGDSVGALTLVAHHDDACTLRSKVTFTATVGPDVPHRGGRLQTATRPPSS